MKRLMCPVAAALLISCYAKPAFAWWYYPYYFGPYRVERPVDPFPPSGAALGPWKWTFDFGGGPTVITGTSRDHLTGGWNFSTGLGYNFTPRVGLMFEFMNSGLGLTDAEMQKNQAIDGDAYVWAVTLDPIWRYRIGGPVGGYLIGGGGFYERDERFTQPVQVFVQNGNGGYILNGYQYTHQIDDAGGVNIGAGLTFNLGWGTKFFMEARYHYIFTAGYPTQIIPVTFGLRW